MSFNPDPADIVGASPLAHLTAAGHITDLSAPSAVNTTENVVVVLTVLGVFVIFIVVMFSIKFTKKPEPRERFKVNVPEDIDGELIYSTNITPVTAPADDTLPVGP